MELITLLVEKLLLHLFSIIIPILLYSFYQNHPINKHAPYFYGLLLGSAVFLCMAFPYSSLGFYWDLRNIPLAVAFLYGGYRVGFITVAVILAMRTYIGGDALLFGFVNCFLSASILALMSKGFLQLSPDQRVKRFMLLSAWPMFVSLLMLVCNLYIQGTLSVVTLGSMKDVLFFGVIYLVGAWFAAMLNESIIERNVIKEEIRRVEKMNTLSELAASIAHEVRNPLTVVKGFLQYSSEQDRDQSQKFLPIILEELGRAENILNDYLNFAKPKLNNIERMDLSATVDNLLSLLHPLGLHHGVQLEGTIESGVFLNGDKHIVQQALMNLIKNGIEATPEGGVVTVHLKKETGKAYITITDTGIGMTEEQVKRLGTPYYSTRDKGTGLGTSVSFQYIEMMGGSLSFRSKVNVGTQVSVVFTLDKNKV